MLNFEINSIQIDKIKKITTEEKRVRIKNLEFFNVVLVKSIFFNLNFFLSTLLLGVLKADLNTLL